MQKWQRVAMFLVSIGYPCKNEGYNNVQTTALKENSRCAVLFDLSSKLAQNIRKMKTDVTAFDLALSLSY
jgi:hypothetical protein